MPPVERSFSRHLAGRIPLGKSNQLFWFPGRDIPPVNRTLTFHLAGRVRFSKTGHPADLLVIAFALRAMHLAITHGCLAMIGVNCERVFKRQYTVNCVNVKSLPNFMIHFSRQKLTGMECVTALVLEAATSLHANTEVFAKAMLI